MLTMRESALGAAPGITPGTRRYTRHVAYQLAAIIKARDVVTYEHCRRVAIYAQRLAHAMGLQRGDARDVALAGLIHDLGKTWMQNDVLNKASALSPDERLVMQQHPQIAARIMLAYDVPDDLIEIVLHHHEAYNGTGYPDGLKGNAIPLGARILTVVDVFDALTSSRPYKEAMLAKSAAELIAAWAGANFDPAVVAVFCRLIESRPDFQLTPNTCAIGKDDGWADHDHLGVA
jgi:putative nucleotidyltransferase with HDIG domain